ncbi:MAG: MFS transporter [Pseudomonadota bacterium]
MAIVGANALALSPLISEVAQDLSLMDATDVLRAAAGFGIGTMTSALLLAPQADRVGAANALQAALAGLMIGFALCALAPQLWVLILGQTLAGLASGLALPSAYAITAQIAPKGAEARTMGRVLTGWTLAMVFGVTLSALLADIVHWRAVFAVLSVFSAGLWAVLARANLPNTKTGVASSPLKALKVPGIWRALFVQGCFMTTFYGTYNFLGAHVTQALGFSTMAAALPVLGYGLGFGASVILDPLIDKWGYGRMAPMIFAAISLCLIGVAILEQSLVWLTIAFGLWGLVNHAGLTLITGRLTALDLAQRGAILGLNSAVTYACVTFATLLFTPIYAWGGFALCALVAAGIISLNAIEARFSHKSTLKA